MSPKTKHIAQLALELSDTEKAELVDVLLASLHKSDEAIDVKWQKEVEARIDAYEAGDLQSKALEDVLQKYLDE